MGVADVPHRSATLLPGGVAGIASSLTLRPYRDAAGCLLGVTGDLVGIPSDPLRIARRLLCHLARRLRLASGLALGWARYLSTAAFLAFAAAFLRSLKSSPL